MFAMSPWQLHQLRGAATEITTIFIYSQLMVHLTPQAKWLVVTHQDYDQLFKPYIQFKDIYKTSYYITK